MPLRIMVESGGRAFVDRTVIRRRGQRDPPDRPETSRNPDRRADRIRLMSPNTPTEMHEACGLAGVAMASNAGAVVAAGLAALQHRGQEGAGVATSDGVAIRLAKGEGLVADVLPPTRVSHLPGTLAIGHTRYSTTGRSNASGVQPVAVRAAYGGLIALGHNGHIINAAQIHTWLGTPDVDSDSHLIALLVAAAIPDPSVSGLIAGLREALPLLRGAFNLVILTEQALVAFRDPIGFRPLCVGSLPGRGWAFASESAGLDAMGADFVREINAGEATTVDRSGLRSFRLSDPAPAQLCSFEAIYFARSDSLLNGTIVRDLRLDLGRCLATRAPASADIVVGIPESGLPAAQGYAEVLSLRLVRGLERRGRRRSFIEPSSASQQRRVAEKFVYASEVLVDKRVVLVDDSIVRGTTMRHVVKVLREAGAKEVHVRIASPPYVRSCFFGVNTLDATELIAFENTVEQIGSEIGSDSIGFVDVDDLRSRIRAPNACVACMGGDYPIPPPAARVRPRL